MSELIQVFEPGYSQAKDWQLANCTYCRKAADCDIRKSLEADAYFVTPEIAARMGAQVDEGGRWWALGCAELHLDGSDAIWSCPLDDEEIVLLYQWGDKWLDFKQQRYFWEWCGKTKLATAKKSVAWSVATLGKKAGAASARKESDKLVFPDLPYPYTPIGIEPLIEPLK